MHIPETAYLCTLLSIIKDYLFLKSFYERKASKRQDMLNNHINTVCKIEQMQGKDTRYYTYVWTDAAHKKRNILNTKRKKTLNKM